MSLGWNWVKRRWKESRYGSGVYLSSLISFFNLIILLQLRYALSNFESVAIFVGLTALTIVIGHFHWRKQQETDAIMDNKAVIDEIVRQVKEAVQK